MKTSKAITLVMMALALSAAPAWAQSPSRSGGHSSSSRSSSSIGRRGGGIRRGSRGGGGTGFAGLFGFGHVGLLVWVVGETSWAFPVLCVRFPVGTAEWGKWHLSSGYGRSRTLAFAFGNPSTHPE